MVKLLLPTAPSSTVYYTEQGAWGRERRDCIRHLVAHPIKNSSKTQLVCEYVRNTCHPLLFRFGPTAYFLHGTDRGLSLQVLGFSRKQVLCQAIYINSPHDPTVAIVSTNRIEEREGLNPPIFKSLLLQAVVRRPHQKLQPPFPFPPS